MFNRAILTINLKAIADNFSFLSSSVPYAKCAVVTKANAYGLGVEKVAHVLFCAGARDFFVANLDEAIQLRKLFSASDISDVGIYVFHGVDVDKGQEQEFARYNLTPVLNHLGQVKTWQQYCSKLGTVLPCVLHIDTGMNRLGMSFDEAEHVREFIRKDQILYIMSHLACADDIANPLNITQLEMMRSIKDAYPNKKISLANSSGIFLGSHFHFDMVRAGSALYGVRPCSYKGKNPMKQVVTLTAPILQIRMIEDITSIGYGATATLKKGSLLATIGVGYADGYLRSLSNKGKCFIGGYVVPVVGRVSMDLITIDISNLPQNLQKLGVEVELLGENIKLEDMAKAADTIGYEILTSLGDRYKRVYS